MKDVQIWTIPSGKCGLVAFILVLFGTMTFTTVDAQSTIRVPDDYPTIASAIAGAATGDTIKVRGGNWCGTDVNKRLNMVGEGNATIVGCSTSPSPPPDPLSRFGFRLSPTASGSTIRHFVFDGRGYSETNRTPLSEGIRGRPGTNDVIVEHNDFLGGTGAMTFTGSGWTVAHNVIEGFTIHSPSFAPTPCVGGYGIAALGGQDTTVENNQITASVPDGNYALCSWAAAANVPFVGIVISAQDRAEISKNKISITTNSAGDGGAGILSTDFGNILRTNINSVITSNDGRQSAYSLIITLDAIGGTGNTVGATILGNKGLNLINGISSAVGSNSIHTLLVCDNTGVCS